jgi:thiol-disulfide isomerase/thioredoxin
VTLRRLGIALSLLLVAAGDASPHVELLDGAPALKQLLRASGEQPIVLHFFATWCGSCRTEMPVLKEALARARADGAATALLSLDDVKARENAVPAFLEKYDLHDPAYLLDAPDPDPVTRLIDQSWSGDLPATFVFRNGKRVASFLGPLKSASSLNSALFAKAQP